MAKKTNTLQSLPAGAVIKNLIIQQAKVESADIGTWRTALNNAARSGNRNKLYDLMDNVMLDPVLSSAVERRTNKITNAEITFQVNGESVEAIDDMIDTPEFEDLIKEIALSRAYGKSVVEVGFTPELSVFSFPRKNIRITNLEKPLSERKRFIALKPSDTSGYDYTEDEFILEAGGDNDFGYIFKAAAYVIYKRGGFGDWAQYAEIFGMPFLVGTYNSADEKQRDMLFEALSMIGGKPIAAIPEGTKLEVNDVGGKSTDLFDRFKKACDEEILISVLGQTMTTVDGSSRSQAEVHSDTEEGIAQSDRRYVQRILNRYFVPLLIKRGYNVSGGFFLFPDQGETISTKDRLEMGFKMRSEGLEVDEDYFFEISGIPRAKNAGEGKKEKKEKESDKKEDDAGKGKETSTKESNESEKKLSDVEVLPDENDTKGIFKWLSDFFADARTQWSRASLNLRGKSTDFIHTGIELSDDTASTGINVDKLFDKALRNIFRQKGGDIPIVEENLFNISNAAYQKAIDTQFKNAGVEFGKTNKEFIAEFKHNAAVFAAFKNHRQTTEIAAQLLDENGNLRSFHDFKKAVLGTSIKADYNRRWLQTEYNTAVRSARQAAKFKKYKAVKHIYPNLEFTPSTAATPREEHKEYYGTILPIDDPWWDSHTPPLDWGCECGIRNTDKDVTGVPVDIASVDPVFDNNPGKTAEIVNMKEHPYVKGVPVEIAKKIRTTADNLASKHELIKKFKNGGRVFSHIFVDKKASDYKDILTISVEFARDGKTVVITPKLHHKSIEYQSVYRDLLNTKYSQKCPDIKVDNSFYEYESYAPPFSARKISNMIKRGAAQSPKIIINNNKGASDRYIRRSIINRINDKNFKHEIEEVWIYEKGKIRLLYKKQ